MNRTPAPNLTKPRIETLEFTRLAGIVERYECKSPAGIPNQWQRFLRHLGYVPNQIGEDAFGVCYNFDEDERFDYLTGVEVRENAQLPFGLVRLDLPKHRYAIFSYGGHISEIRAVIAAIWSEGLPASGHEPVKGPTLEKYGPQFDPATGQGGFEIWIAVK